MVSPSIAIEASPPAAETASMASRTAGGHYAAPGHDRRSSHRCGTGAVDFGIARVHG